MTLAEADIPARFWSVPYDGARIPEVDTSDLSGGANCQRFAYALVAHFGFQLPPFRSSDLWDDAEYTEPVHDELAPLDLLLFGAHREPWGAHVAVALGDGRAIHLSQRVGRPAIWTLDRFAQEADYRVLIGAKRPRRPTRAPVA